MFPFGGVDAAARYGTKAPAAMLPSAAAPTVAPTCLKNSRRLTSRSAILCSLLTSPTGTLFSTPRDHTSQPEETAPGASQCPRSSRVNAVDDDVSRELSTYERSRAEMDAHPRSLSVRSKSSRKIASARATPASPAAARPYA